MKSVSSGNKLVDWFFSKAINSLNENIETIYVRNRLKSGKETLYGCIEDDVIYLSREAHRSLGHMAKTLLHETFHYVFNELPEEDVLKLEDLVWKRLSKKQKEMLKFYIPNSKKKVKNRKPQSD